MISENKQVIHITVTIMSLIAMIIYKQMTTFLLILFLFTGCPLIHEYSTNVLLCYDCLNSTAPDYLTELLRIYKPTRQLRSPCDISILCLHSVGTHSLGQRSFSYAVWNTP